MQLSGAAVPVACKCWVLPHVHLMCFKVHYFLWISQCNPLLRHVQGHTVICSPSPFHSLKKTQQTNFPPSKKTPSKTKKHLSITIYLIMLGFWACSWQQSQKLSSLHLNSKTPLSGSQIKSNRCLFHCPNKFFINCIRSLRGREKGKRRKKLFRNADWAKCPQLMG